MDLIHGRGPTVVAVAAALVVLACEQGDRPGGDPEAPVLLVSDIDDVLLPGCVAAFATGELLCPDPEGSRPPPPSGTRAHDLHTGYNAMCGVEGVRSDVAAPSEIVCWDIWSQYGGFGNVEDELAVPAGSNFTTLARTTELLFCAAGPGVPPVCWGGDPETTPQPREEIATRTDVIGMTTSPCDLCILTADGIVTCNAAEPVPGIKDCGHPLGQQTFTAIDGNEYGVCGVTTEGGLQCADYREDSWHYAWNSAIPAKVEWASFEVAWEGGCGLTTGGEAVCFGTRDLYRGCEGNCGEGWTPDDVDITSWYREARFEGTYAKVVPGLGYVYALRATGELELHWDPDCPDHDELLSCPPDPSIWDALGYTEPIHPQQIPAWVHSP